MSVADIAADVADPDGDDVNSLLEFAFGMDPTANNGGALVFNGTFGAGGTIGGTGQPVTLLEPIANGVDFRALYVRRKDHLAAGLTYTAEFSAALATWSERAAVPAVLAAASAFQVVSVPYPPFIGGKKTRFFRVRMTPSPRTIFQTSVFHASVPMKKSACSQR